MYDRSFFGCTTAARRAIIKALHNFRVLEVKQEWLARQARKILLGNSLRAAEDKAFARVYRARRRRWFADVRKRWNRAGHDAEQVLVCIMRFVASRLQREYEAAFDGAMSPDMRITSEFLHHISSPVRSGRLVNFRLVMPPWGSYSMSKAAWLGPLAASIRYEDLTFFREASNRAWFAARFVEEADRSNMWQAGMVVRVRPHVGFEGSPSLASHKALVVHVRGVYRRRDTGAPVSYHFAKSSPQLVRWCPGTHELRLPFTCIFTQSGSCMKVGDAEPVTSAADVTNMDSFTVARLLDAALMSTAYIDNIRGIS